MSFREDGPSTPANQGHEGQVHGERLFPGREPEGEMEGVGQAETSWGAPCSAKHTACVNPKHEPAEEKTAKRNQQLGRKRREA